jgi:hypothetical protein
MVFWRWHCSIVQRPWRELQMLDQCAFWDLWCPSVVEVVAGRGDFVVEVVDVVDGGFDCVVVMAVVEVVG